VAVLAADALLDLGTAAELLAEAVAQADAGTVRFQLGADRQVAGDQVPDDGPLMTISPVAGSSACWP
jgi:hypothetical protein